MKKIIVGIQNVFNKIGGSRGVKGALFIVILILLLVVELVVISATENYFIIFIMMVLSGYMLAILWRELFGKPKIKLSEIRYKNPPPPPAKPKFTAEKARELVEKNKTSERPEPEGETKNNPVVFHSKAMEYLMRSMNASEYETEYDECSDTYRAIATIMEKYRQRHQEDQKLKPPPSRRVKEGGLKLNRAKITLIVLLMAFTVQQIVFKGIIPPEWLHVGIVMFYLAAILNYKKFRKDDD